MTTGEKLKKQLGLSKLKQVRITRVIESVQPLYFIFFDSKGYPVTNSRIWKKPNVFSIYHGSSLDRDTSLTPLMDLEDFNPNSLKGRLFILIDLVASNQQNKGMFESNQLKEIKHEFYLYGNIYELLEGSGFNIADLRKNAVSPITKKYAKKRRDEGQSGNTLENVIWSENNLLLQFFVLPTYEQTVKNIDTNGNEKIDNHYEVEIMFEEIDKFLGTKEEFLNLSKGDQINKVRELIKKGEVRIHASDPSWFFQGGFENADILNYEIYDFPGPKGKGIWSKRHKGESPAIYITKHIQEVLSSIPFISDEIVNKIIEESK